MLGWMIAFIWIVLIGLVFLALDRRGYDKAVRRLHKKRPNLSREKFLAEMQPEVSQEATDFLWATVLVYLEPHATPHPDDDLIRGLPIAEEDILMDWPADWQHICGKPSTSMPTWPEDMPLTIRNYGHWLDEGAR